MGVQFKVVTLKPQKVTNLGLVEAGVDVTEQLGEFRHLMSLVDMGDVALIPVGDAPVAVPYVRVAAPQSDPVEETTSPSVDSAAESPEADVEVPEEETPEEPTSVDDAEPVADEYMDDPTGFTIEEVVAYATAHPDHASMLLELETEGKARKSLIKALTTIAES